MKPIVSFLLLFFSFFFFSCNNGKEKINTKSPDAILDCNVLIVDFVKNIGENAVFDIDDFPITDEMILTNYLDDRQGGNLYSRESAWFVNDSTKEVLIFSLATDLHRLKTFCFLTKEIPGEILSAIDLHTESGKPGDSLFKETSLPAFVNSAKKIPTYYFISIKGIKLGDCKDKLVRIYGQPDNVNTVKGIEKIEWFFEGSEQYLDKPLPVNKIIAKKSFGHAITMFFKNQRLIGYLLINDMP